MNGSLDTKVQLIFWAGQNGLAHRKIPSKLVGDESQRVYLPQARSIWHQYQL